MTMRKVSPKDRPSLRSLLSVRAIGWTGVTTVLLFGTLIAAPVVARDADRHGLPGTAIGLGMVACLAALSVVAARTSLPHLRRHRSMVFAARTLGLQQVERFRLSSSQRALPALGSDGPRRSFESLLAGHWQGATVFVVDYAIGNPSDYMPMHQRTCALVRIPVTCPVLTVQPRHLWDVISDPGGTVELAFESESFDRRYRVRTTDRLFAEAFIDTRMMAWLIDLPDAWEFEVAGEWALGGTSRLAPDRLNELLANLEAFRKHVPRVVGSLFSARPDGPQPLDPRR
jgi:hypothetical protein